PYVLREMRAAKDLQGAEAEAEFDDAFTSHLGHVLANGMRAFVHGVTSSRLSAAFAFLADMSMMAMGGALKRKEKISGRLGDVLSMMYLVSAMLKHYEDQRVKED